MNFVINNNNIAEMLYYIESAQDNEFVMTKEQFIIYANQYLLNGVDVEINVNLGINPIDKALTLNLVGEYSITTIEDESNMNITQINDAELNISMKMMFNNNVPSFPSFDDYVLIQIS